ncbi:MAG TPA: hypothetical protein VIF40_03240 [Methylosinus sp.]|uniref:hypothetical protein n=1 Tax=Methylosinus sp. TaxID=427 RepID=UPI002F955E41
MSIERIFNIFVYFDCGVVKEYGVRHHTVGGSDQEKTDYLLSHIAQDHPIAHRFSFTRRFNPPEWLAAQRHGNQLGYFEEAFDLFRASAMPVFCTTCIVDGKPIVDRQIGPEPFRGEEVTAQEGWGSVPDYLVHYTNEDGLRFTDLIHDDYFKAIRVLFNERLYVSCSKLLMSCIDTIAFVEYGDVSGNFTQWVDAYVKLHSLGISANELWEFRNSILHMTNLSSRKIMAGSVSPIMPYVGGPRSMSSIAPGGLKPFNLHELIKAVGSAIGKWAETYSTDRDKILKFIERYDSTISDSRMVWVRHQESE